MDSSARTSGSRTRPGQRSTRRWRSVCSPTSRSSTTCGWTDTRTRSTSIPSASSTASATSPALSTSSLATARRCSRTA
ncbi:pectinesterase [Musa troglodytarum]|uniref:Pectinesterase n=1 Tax=Musa troglodytarum TaxID=320322 RepID=A0A9E7FZK3_9LILI|nr:pectinesterase [Musa troglodytarum]